MTSTEYRISSMINSQKPRIGMVGLSQPLEEKGDVEDGIRLLQEGGYIVRRGDTLTSGSGYKTANAELRARDLQDMFIAPDVDIILNLNGGYSSNEILELLDYDLIAEHPKLFVGYSDLTAVMCALRTKSNTPTAWGPMLVDLAYHPSCFSEFFEMLDVGGQQFAQPAFIFEDPSSRRPTPPLRALPEKDGSCEGVVVCANLSTFNLLLGTPFFPSLEGAILFLEYDKEEANALPSLERLLWQLRLAGVFRNISALCFGALQEEVECEERPGNCIGDILERVTNGYAFPVLYNLPFGHIYPSWCIVNDQKIAIQNTKICPISATLAP